MHNRYTPRGMRSTLFSPHWEHNLFVLGHISSDNFVAYTNAGSTGTKMPRTSWKDMGKYQIVIPSNDFAGMFSLLIEPIAEKIIKNIHESHTLSFVRDTLLPKLISGEIRVPEAEKQVEAGG
jgi:type I restriction enzyme, S subunit